MPKKKRILLAAAVLLGAGVVALAFVLTDGRSDPPPEIGEVKAERRTGAPASGQDLREPAPDFELPTLDGGSFKLSNHSDDVVVVNFWATWCAPCRIEIPDLIEMQAEVDGIQIVGISLDHEGREVVQAFAEDAGFNYPIIIDDGTVAEKFGGIYALPTTILVDGDGMIRRRIPGMVTKKLLTPILEDLTRG